MMDTIRPRRSVLYMPGSNARAIEKARTLPADAVILDLEDSVAPDAKAAARKQVADAVAAGSFGAREVIVRINGLDTQWWLDDLDAAAKGRPDAVLVPKVSTPKQLEDVAERLIDISADEAREILREAPGCLVIDKREPGGYATPYEAVGEDATYISRIREDPTVDNGLVLWCVADNLRKGAALNAIQIAEVLINRKLLSAKKKAA